MPKPNYQYEKRQRDLAKKKQKEEKLAKKRAKKQGDPNAEDGESLTDESDESNTSD